MDDYARTEALVDTAWAAEHVKDPNVRFAEIDVDTYSYEEAHVPGAVGWNWTTDLCDTRERDILSKAAFEELMSRSGISNDTMVVLYGDNHNWFAAWAFWQMKIHGHEKVALMNGGRQKWIEEGRQLATEVPKPARTTYRAKDADSSLRAMLAEVREAVSAKSHDLVDVRSPGEFTGELLAPPGLPETCQRGGHLPGAVNVPWGTVCNEDGTFKGIEQLRAMFGEKRITGSKPIIAYCRIGERSSHMWFVLKYLLGFDRVKNYDGSWTEWGNLVHAPIEKP